MSTVPSDDYIKATKLIESFSCFFDRINTVSNNQDNNSKKFSQLKKALYDNIHSPEQILSTSENLCGRLPEVSRFSSKNSSQISFNSVEPSQKDELHSSSLSQNYSKPRSFTHSLTQSGLNKNETKQIASQDGVGDSAYEKTQLSTEFLPSTSFLALIKAASHSDMSKLFSLTSSYANIRTFSDRQQPIFTALCFGYIEQLLREKSKNPESLDQKENEFLSYSRSFLQNSNEADTMKKFYENISMNPRFHQLAVSLFKQQLLKIAGENQFDLNKESFEWMNNLDIAEETPFYQNLTQIFKCTLRFLILSSDRLVEKVFNYEKPSSSIKVEQSFKTELTIFYDKNFKSVFILYPSKKHTEEESESSLYQKTKAKASFNLYNKPPLNSDSLKSFKSLGGVEASMNTLDTFSGSVTSLNDLVENKEKERTPIQRANSISKPQQLRKANTLNVFTTSLNDCSTSFTYPESAVVRPSTEKIVPPSPHSASNKDIGFSRSKTFDEEDSLTPKGKEPVPTRPGNHAHRENSVGDLKVNGILPQNLAQKLSKEILNGKNFFLDRSGGHESNSRPYMSDSKPKTDYMNGKTLSMDFSIGDFTVKKLNDKPSVVRPTVVPISVKSRVDRFNQTINKNEQELNNITSKYLKKEDTLKGSGLTNIMGTYQNIINQSKDNNRSKPSIGTALKMDN